jgi:hypothetical protein
MLAALLTFLAWPVAGQALLADEGAIRVVGVDLGYGGVAKVGGWLPLRARLEGGSSASDAEAWEVLFIAEDPDGVPVEYPASAIRTANGGQPAASAATLWEGGVRLGRLRGALQIEVRQADSGRLLHRHRQGLTEALHATQPWTLAIGDDLGLDRMARRRRWSPREAPVVTRVDGASELPREWHFLEGVDRVALATSRPEFWESIEPRQWDALQLWVQMGGELMISCGVMGEQLIGPGRPLDRFVPGALATVESLARAPGLESFARADQQLPPITVSGLEDVQGLVVTRTGGRGTEGWPAIIRRPHGFGQILFCAFDLDVPALAEWENRDRLLDEIFAGRDRSDSEEGQEGRSRRVTHFGYDEMAGQLRSALDYFPGVRLINFSLLAVLVAGYLMLLGPLDYLLLRRGLRRMEWTWLTLPVWIVLTVVVVLAIDRWRKGEGDLRLNQVDLIDVDVESGRMRGTTWAHLFSARARSIDLRLRGASIVAEAAGAGDALPSERATSLEPVHSHDLDGSGRSGLRDDLKGQLSWQGLPGSGLGGFDSLAGRNWSGVRYRVASADEVELPRVDRMPIDATSTRALLGRWHARLPQANALTGHAASGGASGDVPAGAADERFAGPATRLEETAAGVLRGVLVNPFSVPLRDPLLLHGRSSYSLGRDIGPGESVSIANLARRDLEWRLTRRRALHARTSYATTPWNPRSRDLPRIMEVMMFHSAAGGSSYTQLAQRYQHFVDLSDHLRLGRAVLVARIDSPAAELLVDGEPRVGHESDRHLTFARLVFPVQAPGVLTDRSGD